MYTAHKAGTHSEKSIEQSKKAFANYIITLLKFHAVEVVFNVVLVCLVMGKCTLDWNLNSLNDTERTATNTYETHTHVSECGRRKAFGCFVAFVEVVGGLYPW